MASYLYWFLTACVSLICLVNNSDAKPDLDQLLEQNTNDPFVKFLVVGDWGRRGLYNQSQVATQMGLIGEKEELDFIISTGDNFYEDGLTGVDDPAFNESFSNIYTAPSLQKPWYSVLGNHDYRGNVLAQLNPALKQIDGRWKCARYFTVNADRASADIIFVDTTPFVDKYFTDPKEHVYDWRGVLPRENYLSTVLKFLDERLKESTAKWKFVVGHHTIYSAGHHSNTTELITQVLPVLEANNVDFYFNGHDHCVEHISDPDSKIEFFTSGGGSKAWRGDIKPWNPEDLKLYYDGQGFMSVKITETSADIEFYDVSGNVLHKWSKSKELNSVTHRTFTYA